VQIDRGRRLPQQLLLRIGIVEEVDRKRIDIEMRRRAVAKGMPGLLVLSSRFLIL
jgi:hypothetical protein